ncbi:hypothetical protein GOV10_01580 [Candidatus Woesearchaeota archaeon]|nr:hypothetical protein [Candidatus Woesearchaeota archaeon]
MSDQGGWWSLTCSGHERYKIELSDIDKEHIAEQIKKGFTSGEICKYDGDEE